MRTRLMNPYYTNKQSRYYRTKIPTYLVLGRIFYDLERI